MHRMCMRIFSKGKAYVYDDNKKGRIEDGCKCKVILWVVFWSSGMDTLDRVQKELGWVGEGWMGGDDGG